jgi:hypothetical protein
MCLLTYFLWRGKHKACTDLDAGCIGFMLYNGGGLRFNGLSFDDNQYGRDSFQVCNHGSIYQLMESIMARRGSSALFLQAQNVCLLARYGNQGDYGSKGWPRSKSRGILGSVRGPHFFGNCKKDSDCDKCSNAKLMRPGQDFARFSIGNSCKGDKDLDNVWVGVKCYYEGMDSLRPEWWSGRWGLCISTSTTCAALGVNDNLCGACTKIPSGFMLYNPGGLRFNGYGFDDKEFGKGSIQVQNVCLLARFGNRGKYSTSMPTGESRAFSGGPTGPHYFGACFCFGAYERIVLGEAMLLALVLMRIGVCLRIFDRTAHVHICE